MFLILVVTTLSVVSICFSETGSCGLIGSEDLLIVDLMDIDAYRKIINHITQEKTIFIFFNALAPINDYNVKIPLSLFVDREIYTFEILNTNVPKSIIFTYLGYEDFSSTSFYNFNYEIHFEYIGKSKNIVALQFNTFYYDYNTKSMLLPVGQAVILKGNTINCASSVLLNFNTVFVLENTDSIAISVTENNNISFFEEKIIIFNENRQTTIMNEFMAEIEIYSNDQSIYLNLIGNDLESANSPTITINDIVILTFNGIWSNSNSEIKNSANYDKSDSLVFFITINCTYVPFNIIGPVTSLNILTDFTILGQLICPEVMLIKTSSFDEVSNIYMKYVDASVNTNVAGIILVIEKYKYSFWNDNLPFPITFTFDEKHISQVIINDIEMSGLRNRIIYYSFVNIMKYQPADEELQFILSGDIPFLQMPKIHFIYWQTNQIYYTPYSKHIDGFKNSENILKLKLDDSGSIVKISTYGTRSLSQIDTKLCIGSMCSIFSSTGIYIANSSDLAESFDFNQNVNRFYIHLYSDQRGFAQIGLQNLPNKDLILRFVSPPNVNLQRANFQFPSTKDSISQCMIALTDLTKLYGHNKFVARQFDFSGVRLEEGASCEIDCDLVETDSLSIDMLMNADYIENLTVHVEYTSMTLLLVTNDYIIIDGRNVYWNKVGNLTIIGFSFYFIMMSDDEMPPFHIVCSTEPSNIAFVGNWKNAKFEDSIHIHANGFQTTLNIMEPFNHNEIKLHGDGKFTIRYIYSNASNICVYVENQFCGFEYTTYIHYNDISKIYSIENDNINIGLGDFLTAELPVIDLSVFHTKQVKLKSVLLPIMNVVVTPPAENQELTEFIFENINLEINSTEENLTFNYLTLTNSQIHSEANDLIVECLTCTFDNLVGWNNIYIKDTLVVYGSVPEEEFRVILLNEIKDCTSDISMTSNEVIIFCENVVKIRNGSFIFSEKHKGLPIRFNLLYLTLILDYDDESKKVPSCSISVIGMSSITFIGDWTTVDHYFRILLTQSLTIINNNFIKCDISGIGSINYVSNSTINGFNGTVNLKSPEMYAPPTFYLSTLLNHSMRTRIIFNDLILDPNYEMRQFSPFSFQNSNIDLEIVKVAPDSQEFTITYKINLYLDDYGVSTITFVEPFNNFFLIRNVTEISMNIVGKLKADEAYAVLNRNFSIIRGIKHDMMTDFTLSFITFSQPVNAFKTILAIDLVTDEDEMYTDLVLYARGRPSYVPYHVQFLGFPLSNVDYWFDKEESVVSLFSSFLSTYLQNIQITVADNLLNERIRLSDVNDAYSEVILTIISELNGLNKIISFDSPGSGILDLSLLSLTVNNKEDISFENVRRLSIIDTEFISDHKLENFSNLEYFFTDLKTLINIDSIAEIKAPNSVVSIERSRYIKFCDDGWLLSEDLAAKPIKILESDFQLVQFIGNRIFLSLENPGKQTRIPKTLIYLSPNFVETDVLIVFDDGFDKITNIDQLNFTIPGSSYVNKIIVSTTFFPVPDIFPPGVRLEIVCNTLSSQNFKLSEQTLSNKTIDVDLADVSSEKRVIQANSVNVNGFVDITFANKVGLLESNQLNLMDGGHLSVNNYRIKSNIIAQPRTSSSIERIMFEDDMDLEIHWIKGNWPTMMIGCDDQSKRPSNIRVILDEDSPDYEEYYDFTYLKSRSILVGSFNCERWKSQVHFEARNQYFRDSSSLIFNITCSTDSISGNTIMSIFGSRPLPLPSDNSESKAEDSQSKSTMIISIAVAVVIVITFVIGVIVFFTTKKRYEAILKQKMNRKNKLNKKHENNDTELDRDEENVAEKDLVEIEQIAETCSDDVSYSDAEISFDSELFDNVDAI